MKLFKKLFLTGVLLSILPFSANAAEGRVLHFATEATYPPFVTMKPDGTLEGFETALVKALCTEAKFTCDFRHMPFDSLLPSLAYKKIDAIYGGIGSTEERKKQVLFSKPIFVNPWALITAKDKPLEMTQASLQGKSIGVQQGTFYENYFREHFGSVAKIKTYLSILDAFLELKTGRVDVVFGDEPVLNYWFKSAGPEVQSTLVITELPIPANYSGETVLGFRKDEKEIVEKFNAALEKIKANGTYQKIIQEHLK